MAIKKRPTTGSLLISSASAREVRNADLFKEEMTKLNAAAIGVMLIRTREPYRCQEILYEWAAQEEIGFRVWTILTGWQDFPGPRQDQPGVTAPLDAPTTFDLIRPSAIDKQYDYLKALDALASNEKQKFGEKGCYIMMMSSSEPFTNPSFQQHIKVHLRRAFDLEQRIIFLVPEGTQVPVEVQDDIHIVDFMAPSHAELRELWDEAIASVDDEGQPGFTDEEVDMIIQSSLGMSAHEFDTGWAMATVTLNDQIRRDKTKVTAKMFTDLILKTKIDVIKKTGILELLPSESMNEVGGLDLLKKWIRKRAKCYSEKARMFGVRKPRGCLLIGPPGSGKSKAAKAIASELGIPAIRFDFGKVFNKFVGESEQRIDIALQTAEACAPIVLLVDEMDKAFGGADGSTADSGTTSRVFGKFLSWMQDRPADAKPIFIAMTANNVQGLPPELMRKGRVDEIFAVLLPVADEAAEILKIHLEKRGHELPSKEIARVVKRMSGFIGAEIEAIVESTLVEVFDRDGDVITADDLIEEADKLVPLARAFPEKIAAMQAWAKLNARPSSSKTSFDEPVAAAARTDDGVKRPSLLGRLGTGKKGPFRPKSSGQSD